LKKKSLMIGVFLFYLMAGAERASRGKGFLSARDADAVGH